MSFTQQMVDLVIARAEHAVITTDEAVRMAYVSGTFTKDVLRICEAKIKVDENAVTAPSSPAISSSSTLASITEEASTSDSSSSSSSSSSTHIMEESTQSSSSSSSSSTPPVNPHSIMSKVTSDEEISVITILTNKLNADEHVFKAAQKAADAARAMQKLIKQLLLPEHANEKIDLI
jgi:hypothetical protein